jgi:hypothetical protein
MNGKIMGSEHYSKLFMSYEAWIGRFLNEIRNNSNPNDSYSYPATDT